MPASPTRAIDALLAAHPRDWVWGQVWVRRRERGFALSHADDRDRTESQLRPVHPADLRLLAQHSGRGEYRPLKAAPDLISGWQAQAASAAELEAALNALYPGSVADWFAARSPTPPVTSFREFTGRQTGMYRISAMLSDAQAARVIRATCAAVCCLKRRLWTVNSLAPDEERAKSAIPCLEPCAVLLEFARKARRIEQQPPLALELRPDDAASAVAALEQTLANGQATGRAAEVSSPANPFRLRLTLEKLRAALALARPPEESEE